MDIRLDGKTAIVTGSIQGIGRASAEILAECGASVVINNHQEHEQLEKVAEEMRGKGYNVLAVTADVSKRIDGENLVKQAFDFGGSIDILVNNAGGLVQRIPVEEFDDDHFQTVIDINLKSAFLVSHLVIPYMKKQGRGKIVNLSSQAAHDGGGPGSAAYSASKGGIMTFTKSLAKEQGPAGIYVNSISPGFIAHTAFHDTFTPMDRQKNVPTQVPLRRSGNSLDVARAVLFLASELSDYISGQTIEVNGGLYMY